MYARSWVLAGVVAFDHAADVERFEALAFAVDQQQVAVGGDGPGRDHGVVGGLLLRRRYVDRLEVGAPLDSDRGELAVFPFKEVERIVSGWRRQ